MTYFPKGTYKSFNGTKSADLIEGTDGSDVIAGNAGDDEIYGRMGNDYILGGKGNDEIYGGRGIDILNGGTGNDYLNGGRENDRLAGDFGADRLEGGLGADLFYFDARTAGQSAAGKFNASDRILDFETGDTIRFGGYNTAKTKLAFVQDGSNTKIFVDVDGNGSNDYLAVTVLNVAAANVEAATSFGDFLV